MNEDRNKKLSSTANDNNMMKTKITMMMSMIGAVSMLLASCASSGAGVSGVKPYQSDMCAMTDNKLGSMGPVVTKVYDGKEVKFCCKPCIAKFEKNLERNLANL